MNCLEIIRKHLEDNGFDGLQNGGECGCELSNLVPCSENPMRCTPGYRWPGNEDYDFIIGPTKQKTSTEPAGQR